MPQVPRENCLPPKAAEGAEAVRQGNGCRADILHGRLRITLNAASQPSSPSFLMPAYPTVCPSKCFLPCTLFALESPASLAAVLDSVQHHPAPVRFGGGMCYGDTVQVRSTSATSLRPPWAGEAFHALPSRKNTPLVQRKQNKTRRLTESPCSSESVFTIVGAGLACEETKAGCHRAERWTQPFAVHCLSPDCATTGRRGQFRNRSALVPPPGAQKPQEGNRATAQL